VNDAGTVLGINDGVTLLEVHALRLDAGSRFYSGESVL
jgi:hypothetical protein